MSSLLSRLANLFPSGWGGTGAECEQLSERMAALVRKQNADRFHPYKAHIVSVRSKELLNMVNSIEDVSLKIEKIEAIHGALLQACKEAYHVYNPHAMFVLHNEVHFVFFYSDDDRHDFIFNGDVMKTVTSIASFMSVAVLCTLQSDMKIGPVTPMFTGNAVEFDEDFEALNYLVWRQYDTRRHIIELLYKCCHPGTGTYKCSLADMTNKLSELGLLYFLNAAVVLGSVLKKKESEGRRSFVVGSFVMSDSFSDTMQRYIVNKYL